VTGARRILRLISLSALVLLAGCASSMEIFDGAGGAAPASASASPPIWRDDFDGAAGSSPDVRFWTVQTGGGGWGNGELQTYTKAHAALDGNSHLVLSSHIRTESSGDISYGSGRVTSGLKRTFQYGVLSARIKLPDGHGLLPAFWLLGADVQKVGWPAAGEIDVVETPDTTAWSSHTIHGPSMFDSTVDVSSGRRVSHETRLSDGFHVYSVARTPTSIRLSIDGQVVESVTKDNAPPGQRWVFDKPESILFSLAIGGAWPGKPDASTPANAEMVIDWVQVTR
jgi:beta-glucanase (GH16 family)